MSDAFLPGVQEKYRFEVAAHKFMAELPRYESFNPSPVRGHFPSENAEYVRALIRNLRKYGLLGTKESNN